MKIEHFRPTVARACFLARALWLKHKLSRLTGLAWSYFYHAGKYVVKPPISRDKQTPYKRGNGHE